MIDISSMTVFKGREVREKLCTNCIHALSKFYYWKESPCDACIRSPARKLSVGPNDCNDHWSEGRSFSSCC